MADPAIEKAIASDVHERKGAQEDVDLELLGYKPELIRTRSLYTILFQSLAIAAVPFGEGTALLAAVIGGGQLAYFLGWIVVCILDQCVAMSLAELASRFPTAAGPYYWSCAFKIPFSVSSLGSETLLISPFRSAGRRTKSCGTLVYNWLDVARWELDDLSVGQFWHGSFASRDCNYVCVYG